MRQINLKLRVFLTNWINFLGIFLSTYIAIMLSDINNLPYTLLSSLYSVLGYGFLFWRGFFITIFLMDIVLLNKRNVNIMLLIEYVIISIPFIYWGFKYNEWIFFVAIIAFLISQYLRKDRILKIFNDYENEV